MRRTTFTRREALGLFGSASLASLLAACGAQQTETDATDATATDAATDAAEDDVVVRVASLKGPTTIGLVHMMDTTSGIPTADEEQPSEAEEGSGITYAYTISSAPDEVLPMVIQGTADIALVPANAGSVLYNKTEGKVQVIDINTLGILSVVTGDEAIVDFADLAGKTVFISGKGSSPEYVLNYLLEQAGIADEVTVEWKSEHTEVAAVLASDPMAVGVLPQPFVTATLAQNEALSAPIDLTEVWDATVDDGSQAVTGVTVVRADFAAEHPAAVSDFLARHADSVDAVNADPAAAAELVVAAGIIEKAPIAEKAIPACNVVCVTGEEMREALEGYLQVLYDADASSVGGALPGDDFYYLGAAE